MPSIIFNSLNKIQVLKKTFSKYKKKTTSSDKESSSANIIDIT
jgi:hypothetical protein